MSEQPKASVQYQDYKKWPKTYREPTSEEWDKELSDLRTQLAEKDREIDLINMALFSSAVECAELYFAIKERAEKAEAELAEKEKEIEGWHKVVKECELLFGCEDTAESYWQSNLSNLVRDMKAENAELRERLKPVEEVYKVLELSSEWQLIQAIKAACEKGE